MVPCSFPLLRVNGIPTQRLVRLAEAFFAPKLPLPFISIGIRRNRQERQAMLGA